MYDGRISHPQNIALVKLLGIELVRFDSLHEWEKYAGAIYVDNQGTTAEKIVKHLEEDGVAALVVVDHHELQTSVGTGLQGHSTNLRGGRFNLR